MATQFNFDIPHHRDWEQEGCIVIENPQTIDEYHKLKYENHAPEGEYFFAFSDKQFEEGMKRCNGKKIYRAKYGLFGTKEGLDKYFEYYNNKDKVIAERCNPQEVYYWEYNNHECMFDPYEGDAEPMRLIIDTWGEDIARKINRYSIVYSIDQLIKGE
jgi:hypothetical protein